MARQCPKGHICPAQSVTPTPCYVGTYNPKLQKSKSADCIDCPVGAFCDDRGVVDYKQYACPPGHYCPDTRQIRDPISCAPGYYRNATSADSYDECWPCPAGSFCLEGTDYPTPCDPGYACPAKSSKEYACKPSTYCPTGSPEEIPCPAGFYCPSYRTEQYIKCGNGTYCPPSSASETKCPAGYFGTGRTDNYDLKTSCITCGLG